MCSSQWRQNRLASSYWRFQPVLFSKCFCTPHETMGKMRKTSVTIREREGFFSGTRLWQSLLICVCQSLILRQFLCSILWITIDKESPNGGPYYCPQDLNILISCLYLKSFLWDWRDSSVVGSSQCTCRRRWLGCQHLRRILQLPAIPSSRDLVPSSGLTGTRKLHHVHTHLKAKPSHT